MPKGVPNKQYTPEFKRMVVETMKKEHLSIYTIDDRSYLSAGDVALGLEGTVLITLEHTHAIQNGNRLSVIIADALVILEGVGAGVMTRASTIASNFFIDVTLLS